LNIILDKLIDKCAGTDKDVIMFFERFANLSEIDVKSHLNCLLDRVVQEQKTNFIQLLLKYGADPNYSHDGTTMLLQTVDKGYLAGATLLIEHKANINQVDEVRIMKKVITLMNNSGDKCLGYLVTWLQDILDPLVSKK